MYLCPPPLPPFLCLAPPALMRMHIYRRLRVRRRIYIIRCRRVRRKRLAGLLSSRPNASFYSRRCTFVRRIMMMMMMMCITVSARAHVPGSTA